MYCSMFVESDFSVQTLLTILPEAMSVEGNRLESQGEGKRVTCGKALSNILVFGFRRLVRRLANPRPRRLVPHPLSRGGGGAVHLTSPHLSAPLLT